jgi:hypothetical protein
MAYKFNKFIVYITVLFFSLTETVWMPVQINYLNLPSFIHIVSLSAGNTLRAVLSWSNPANLNLYLYQGGANVYGTGFLKCECSNTTNP